MGIDTRVTGWVECKNGPWYPNLPNGGYTAYRIWQQFDGLRWFQRHEWQTASGVDEIEDWIAGVGGWASGSHAIPAQPHRAAIQRD